MIRALNCSRCTILHWSILFSLLIFILIIFLEIELLANQPGLGLELKVSKDKNGLVIKKITHPELQNQLNPGESILAIRSEKLPYILLHANSLVEDPDNFPTFKEYNKSFQQNAALYQRINSPLVTIKTEAGKEISFKPIQQQTFSKLPLNFWVTNFTALIGLLFAAAIWAYKQQDITTRLLLFSGLFFCIASSASAIYASRSLVLEPEWYIFLTTLNHLAMPIMAYSLLALILVYPHRLFSTPIIFTLFVIPIILWVNTWMQWTDLPLHTFYLGMVLAFIFGIPPSIKQWQLSKNKPIERAALMWMLLAIFIATGSEVFLYLMPTILGESPYLPLWAAQLIFLLLYIGFILGVFKYRLFDVEHWWLMSWQWILSGLLIVCIDLLLVWLLHLNPFGAISIAIIIMAWGYFPLRQWIWKYLKKTPEPHLENHIHFLIQTLLGGNPQRAYKQRWHKLLEEIFISSSAELAGKKIDKPTIVDHGMNMLVPGIEGNYHLDLYGKNNSSSLFGKQDILLVNTLSELASHIKKLQEAQEKGVKLERQRIMRDLHDDVGANLLSMIYRAKNKKDTELAKDTLKLLRETIYTLDESTTIKLTMAIAKWRQEIRQYCQNANIHLKWDVDNTLQQYDLSARQLVNLRRVLRETLSNALKHAKPSYFSVNFISKNHKLILQIAHDGDISPPQSWHDGKGIPSIKARIGELHGKIDWMLTDTLKTTISIPLGKKTKKENRYEITAKGNHPGRPPRNTTDIK